MRVLATSNDPVRLSFLTSLLADAGIAAIVLDGHTSAVEGSIGAIPRRLAVADRGRRTGAAGAEGGGGDVMLKPETNPPRTTFVGAARSGTHKATEPDYRQRWLEENREAIDQYNARIDRDGLTLERYRRF